MAVASDHDGHSQYKQLLLVRLLTRIEMSTSSDSDCLIMALITHKTSSRSQSARHSHPVSIMATELPLFLDLAFVLS